jgi:hypothetical protein
VKKLTKEILENIIKDLLDSIADFKIYFRTTNKNRKLIKTIIRWKLKPKIKYRNKLREKKGKINQFGISFREKHKLEDSGKKIILESHRYTELREEQIFIQSVTRNAMTSYNNYTRKYK